MRRNGGARQRDEVEFSEFVRTNEARLRQAVGALVGPDLARDAVAEALMRCWQDWDRVRSMSNRTGYAYTVARNASRSHRKLRVVFPDPGPQMPEVEPGLAPALADLPERQRVAVLLVHGCDWTHEAVAELMGVSVSTVRNHLARGLDRLRSRLGVHIDG